MNILYAHVNTEWKRLSRQDRKVEAIRSLRALHDLSLKMAKDIVEEYGNGGARYDNGDTNAATHFGNTTVNLNSRVKLETTVQPNGAYHLTLVTREVFIVLPDDLLQMVADLSARIASGGPRA